ncbi:NAD-dependent succinate-semialdehyde dehydrogenase [Myxococcota bacterium]|nr:NAD-dependent succinate-semialdehyde dehydrogenase [Myxococcota bacterium]
MRHVPGDLLKGGHLVGGRWVGAAGGGAAEVANPATDEVLATVPWGGGEDARRAVDAAAAALPEWRARTAAERAEPLRRLASLMLERREDLALLMTLEQGKPLAEARGEVAYAASFVDWAAEEGKRLYGELVPSSHRDKRILVLRQPLGVTAAITPWNFPAAMITRKLGPALAAGCAMVVKPAPQTPLSALAVGALAEEAGIPPGVVNVVCGDAEAIGDALLADPRVRKLSFTGSTEVGRILMAKAARNLTRLSLELGGHAPFLVFDDADVDAAVAGLLASKYRNMGQTCVCPNRILVQGGVYEAFVDRLAGAVAALKVGPGWEEGVRIGPLVDDEAVAKVERHVRDAVSKGARLRAGGERVRPGAGLADRFFAPTVLEDFTPDMELSHEETFGPVSPVRRFETEEEALELANDSPYGLASYFYTRDAARLIRVAEALEYGIVGANDGAPSTAQAPFGGVKHSGFGREGGRYVMDEYVNVKYVSWGGL